MRALHLLLLALLAAPAVGGPRASSAPPSDALSAARTAVACAVERGRLEGAPVLTVIDYRLPSTEPRLWVLDADGQVLFAERVAHGQGSGVEVASAFSDQDGSHQSSLGLFVTAETYSGKHGYSLRLDGLEPGWNDAARSRAIVIHAADYVSESFIRANGRLGRSWGCPALRPEITRSVIDTIQGGSLVFGYYPDTRWLGGSSYLN